MSTIDLTKLVRDVQESTMQQAFYLQSKAFFEKNNEHINEIARLKAEVERLRASSFVTAVPVEQYEKLNAEVERLKSLCDSLGMGGKHTVTAIVEENARLKAEVERLNALVESNLNSSKVAMGKSDAVLHERDSLKAENERLRKAWDAMAYSAYAHCMCQDCEEIRDQWRDAKRGEQP